MGVRGKQARLPQRFRIEISYLTPVPLSAPTLRGECYIRSVMYLLKPFGCCFNGHPPLGVNATLDDFLAGIIARHMGVSMGTHPWG